ncbi:MAG TPA: hypothetical protein VL098_15530 [Flavipsychrobacter sp.]|nr:hypothetical protein [Flavipsychrobacter sp.]
MKKLIALSILSLSLGNGGYAQNCKDLKESKDAFTNKIEKKAVVTLGATMGTKWGVEFIQDDKETIMKWHIAMLGEYNTAIEAGTQLLLKLEDESILTLPTAEAAKPVTQAIGGGAGTVTVYSTFILKFVMNEEDLQKLAKALITNYKVDVSSMRIINPKEKEKQLKQIQNVCSCLLKK